MTVSRLSVPGSFLCTIVNRYSASGSTPGSERLWRSETGTKKSTEIGCRWTVSGRSGGYGTRLLMKPGKASVRFKLTYRDYLKVKSKAIHLITTAEKYVRVGNKLFIAIVIWELTY